MEAWSERSSVLISRDSDGSLSPPREGTARRRPSVSQEKEPQDKPTLLAILSGTASFQNCEE